MWQDFFTALALVLIIEGIMPFLNPQGWRQTMSTIAQMDDKALRIIGLVSMGVGVVVLYMVR